MKTSQADEIRRNDLNTTILGPLILCAMCAKRLTSGKWDPMMCKNCKNREESSSASSSRSKNETNERKERVVGREGGLG